MIGPEGDEGVIPRFCGDLIEQCSTNTNARVLYV